MPIYTFRCEHCKTIQENRCSIEDYTNDIVCGECGKKMYREYLIDNVSFSEGIKTLGSLADKNASKFSNDYKAYLQEKNRTQKTSSGKLPDNMKYVEKGIDGKYKIND